MRSALLATLIFGLLSGAPIAVDAQGRCPTADGWEAEVLAHIQHCPGDVSPNGKVCTFIEPAGSHVWQTLTQCTGWIFTTRKDGQFLSVIRYFDVCARSAILAQSDIDATQVSELCP